MAGTSEPPLIRALLHPRAYAHEVYDLELHETHGAWVVLAGPYAYKLKKPVNLGFFDFSTPELRAADAEAEVRLNRRLAPSTYLGLVDVVERDGAVYIGGRGRVLERAVQMRRLPAEGMLAAMLERDAVTPTLVRRIARMVARFHAAAATGPGVDEYGTRAVIAANWQQNFDQIVPYVGQTISEDHLATIRQYVDTFLAGSAARFDRRVASGRIRDGHGDLHARSICLDGRRLVIFDCIEFADRYRCADVAADIAFLTMDLEHNGRPDLGWHVVEEYVRVSGDTKLRDLLGFYACYRAFVRGKVLSMRLAEPDLTAAERAALVAEARSYFDLAVTHAGGAPRPCLVVTCGLPASGKSTLAHALARHLGMLAISTDVVRKLRAGLRPTDRVHAAFGTGLYDSAATEATYTALRRRAGRWLRRGVSVVLDGAFGDPRQRLRTRGLARRAGVPFLLVTTTCPEETIRARLERRARDPTAASDADWEIYAALRARWVPPGEIPAQEQYVDGTGGEGVAGVVARLMGQLR